MGEGEQASGIREGGEPESTTVVTGGGIGESHGPGQPRVQVTPRAVLVVMVTALALLGGLYLLWELRDIVVWCVVAVFLAVALNPAVDWLDRRGLPRRCGHRTRLPRAAFPGRRDHGAVAAAADLTGPSAW